MKNLFQWMIVFLIFMVSNTTPAISQLPDEVYCNDRFDFCLQYPAEIFKQKVFSANNDGIELHSADGKMIVSVSGINNTLKNTVKEEFEIFKKYLEHNKPGFEIYSSKIEDDHFTSYSSKGSEIYYQKTLSTGVHLIYLVIISKMPTLEQSKMAIKNIEDDLIFLVYP